MATPYAFVTLLTSDSYLPGALALVAALKDLHPSPPTPPEVDFQTICLVTPETVDVSSIKLLRRAFNIVIGVEIIEQEDDKNLRLLGRPDLTTVLTKLHIFRLTQYAKIIFLDADVLPIRPMSHLFSLPHEFSAVPDVGWPDIFNSGVLVCSPGEDKFNELMALQKTKGSWDGGDQGLLNEWRGSDWNRLSFVYNTTPTAAYTYAPAYERFGAGITAIHFIGPDKPWKGLLYRSPGIKSSEATLGDGTKRAYHYEALVDRWYEIYDNHYRRDVVPLEEFQLQRYSSVWDENAGLGAELPSTRSLSTGSVGAMGLDDLRRVAVEGLNAVGGGGTITPSNSGGEYRSMPLEGRVSLMRPPKQSAPQDGESSAFGAEQHEQSEAAPGTPRPTHIRMPSDNSGYFRNAPLGTPAPDEVPPAPYIHGHSLPATATPTPYYGPPSGPNNQQSGQFNNSLQVFYHPQVQSEPGPEYSLVSHPSASEQQQQHQYPQNMPSRSQHSYHHDQHQHQSQDRQSQSTHLQQPTSHLRHATHAPAPQQYQDSSDSDSPTPPATRVPSFIARQQQQQHPHSYQHHIQAQHSHSGQQQQHQYHEPGEQRVQQWANEQQRRSSHSPVDRIRPQSPVDRFRNQARQDRMDASPQRPPLPRTRGDYTPPQQPGQRSPYDPKTYWEARQRDPVRSGHQTPTQAQPTPRYAARNDSYHAHEGPPPQGQHHERHRVSSGQRSPVHSRHLPQPHVEHHHHRPHHHHQPQGQPLRHQDQATSPPPRPSSPPKLNWNPAVEPPPKESPPLSAFPQDTYFPNVWDQQNDSTFQSYHSPERDDPASVFFNAPPPSVIPEQLIREGRYANVLGQVPAPDSPESAVSPPVPDRKKVQAVFPWEAKPRHVPRRVFPRTDSPPPAANYIESERTSSPVSTPPPSVERIPPSVVHASTPTSPLQGIPWNTTFSNAWDTVPSIQRYASKLAGSPKPLPQLFMGPLPPPPDDSWRRQWKEQREKDWQDRQDASSMDGDDEDEDDEEEALPPSEGDPKGRSGGAKGRSRTSSLIGKKKTYKTRGVQATPETSTKEVQVETLKEETPKAKVSREVETIRISEPRPPSRAVVPSGTMAPTGVGLGLRRQWPHGTHPSAGLLPSAVARDFRNEPEQVAGTPAVNTSARSAMPFPSMASPTGLRSPATLGSPRSYSPPRVTSPTGPNTVSKAPSPPRVSSPLAAPSPVKAGAPIGRALSPISASPRSGGVSPHQTASPKLTPLRTTNSPRPSTYPRRTSTSSAPGSSRANSPVVGTTSRLQQQTPSPKHSRLSSLTSPPLASGITRTISIDSSITPSPSSTNTNESLMTPGNTPLVERQRRGSRVWDPARGVDVFKRSSEEVLSRFLRMNSFDDEEGKQRQNA